MLTFFYFYPFSRAVDKIQKELKKSRDEHRKLLQEQHPVLSRISPWLRAKLEAGEQSKLSKITWGAHEEALKIAQKHNLHQSVYFLTRDMAFMKEVSQIVLVNFDVLYNGSFL